MSERVEEIRQRLGTGEWDSAWAEDAIVDLLAHIATLTAQNERLKADAKELREALDDTWDQFRRVADQANQAEARVRALEEALAGTHFHHKKFEPLCPRCQEQEAALTAPELPQGHDDPCAYCGGCIVATETYVGCGCGCGKVYHKDCWNDHVALKPEPRRRVKERDMGERCWWRLAYEAEGQRCPNAGTWANRDLVPPMDKSVWCDEHKHATDEPVNRR